MTTPFGMDESEGRSGDYEDNLLFEFDYPPLSPVMEVDSSAYNRNESLIASDKYLTPEAKEPEKPFQGFSEWSVDSDVTEDDNLMIEKLLNNKLFMKYLIPLMDIKDDTSLPMDTTDDQPIPEPNQTEESTEESGEDSTVSTEGSGSDTTVSTEGSADNTSVSEGTVIKTIEQLFQLNIETQDIASPSVERSQSLNIRRRVDSKLKRGRRPLVRTEEEWTAIRLQQNREAQDRRRKKLKKQKNQMNACPTDQTSQPEDHYICFTQNQAFLFIGLLEKLISGHFDGPFQSHCECLLQHFQR